MTPPSLSIKRILNTQRTQGKPWDQIMKENVGVLLGKKRKNPSPKNQRPRYRPFDSSSNGRHTGEGNCLGRPRESKQTVKDSYPQGWSPHRLLSELDPFDSTGAARVLVGWIVRRPTGKPPPCCNCDAHPPATAAHIQLCAGGNINGLTREGLLARASAALVHAYRKCFHLGPKAKDARTPVKKD